MATIAELLVKIGIDDSGLKKGEQSLDSSLKSIGGKVAGLATSFVSLNTIVKGIEFNKMKQNAEIAFTTMLGSADKANRLMKELRDLSVKTPLEFKDVRQAGQTLLQFGVSAGNVTKTVRMLGDVSLGNAQKLESLSIAFGQVQSAGKLTGQDLLQFINAGFNPLNEIAKTTGETMAELRKRMSDGGVTAKEVADAFAAATSEGGQFNNAMGKLSDSLTGAQSNFQDALDTFMGMATEGATDNLTNAFKELGQILQDLEPQAKRLGDAIGVVVDAGVAIAKFVAGLGQVLDFAPLVGAALGAAFGPWGILIGGLVGTAASLVAQVKNLGKETEVSTKAADAYQARWVAIGEAYQKAEAERAAAAIAAQEKIDKVYLSARERVLKVLESEKSEYERIEEQIQELQKTPWASGQLEQDRLKAIEVLRKKQQQLINERLAGEGKISLEQQEQDRMKAEMFDDETRQYEDMESAKARISQEYRDEEREERRADSQAMAEEREAAFAAMQDDADKTSTLWSDTWGAIDSGTVSYLKGMQDQWKGTAGLIESSLNIVYNGMVNALTDLGEGLAEGEVAWEKLGKTALQVLAEVLKSIGAQLAGLAAVKALSLDFVGAGIAAAGAVAAFVASGVASGFANKLASGTDYARGGMTLVGEQGPEMVRLPQGARVTPAPETKDSIRSGGGGGNTFNFYSPKELDAGEAARQMRATTRQLSFEGVL